MVCDEPIDLKLSWRNIPISNNVGSVKHVFEHTSVCAYGGAPFRSRRWFALSTWARFESLGSETQSDPAISSITNCDQDSFYSNSPREQGAGCPIITSVIYCSPSGCPGSPACQFGPAARKIS